MNTPISLDQFIAAVQMMPYECERYINQRTGEVLVFSDEVMQAIEGERDPDSYSEWEQKEIKRAKKLFEEHGKESVFIPNRAGVRDYNVMKEFCYSIQNDRFRNRLLRLIRGSGAFRRFKNALIQRGIEKNWYRYQQQAHKDNAIAWLEQRGIAYKDDVRPIK